MLPKIKDILRTKPSLRFIKRFFLIDNLIHFYKNVRGYYLLYKKLQHFLSNDIFSLFHSSNCHIWLVFTHTRCIFYKNSFLKWGSAFLFLANFEAQTFLTCSYFSSFEEYFMVMKSHPYSVKSVCFILGLYKYIFC